MVIRETQAAKTLASNDLFLRSRHVIGPLILPAEHDLPLKRTVTETSPTIFEQSHFIFRGFSIIEITFPSQYTKKGDYSNKRTQTYNFRKRTSRTFHYFASTETTHGIIKSLTEKQVMDLTEMQEHKKLNNYSNTMHSSSSG